MINPRSSKSITNFLNLSRIITNIPFSNDPSLFFAVRFISKPPSNQSTSFTISYLKDKLGFLPESALKLANHVNFKTQKTQIPSFILRPIRVLRDPNPKNHQSPTELALFRCAENPFTQNPVLSIQSGLLRSEMKAVVAIRRHPYLIASNLDAYLFPNIKTLIDNGVTESIRLRWRVSLMFSRNGVYLKKKFGKLSEISRSFGSVEREDHHDYGFPSERNAVPGFNHRFSSYHFHPELGEKDRPKVFVCSGFVVGRLIKDFSLSTLYVTPEKVFIEKFVNQHEDRAPELLKLYEEKVEFAIRGKYKIESR
ncbi:hypothetical protein F3Y22_tig00110197pilonHSYRG00002 [Hibiscus syriacus]|uniref:Uncharacterized protein n=1 Tax=Hibiscus syriacus TaxID=106335 RepID=A0A6A3BBN8_HIBSY|nr:hypothetical protein F3Y22_tig00110197pilonHSYRG00002 [Hibiscus syriacus]